MRITDETARKMSHLRYDPDAEIVYCSLPLGSIYFADEVPEDLLPGTINDYNEVMRLLGIRVELWNQRVLSVEDLCLFEAARERFPLWPVFRRLELNPEQRKAHESVLDELVESFRVWTMRASKANSLAFIGR